jgi:hypothetical protein
MRRIQKRINEKQACLSRHPFFGSLDGDFEEVIGFAPALTFWVMTFQDVLRLTASRGCNPELRKILIHHRTEDAGHERWFLSDLGTLGLPIPDVATLFGPEHSTTRDAANALMSEVFRAGDDRLRVLLLLTLESAGHVFFEAIARRVDMAGMSRRLRYFSFSHLDAEEQHDVFGEEMGRAVAAIDLGDIREEAFAMVDRCYAAFDAMFDGLASARVPAVRCAA